MASGRKAAVKKGEPWAYLYVLGCAGGPHKIGYSYSPAARAKAMKREGREGVYVVGAWPAGVWNARCAERYAHWVLRDKHLDHEWFNCDRDEAIAAVEKALSPEIAAGYDYNNMIPLTAASKKKMKNSEWIYTQYEEGTRQRLRDLVGPNGHSDFIRGVVSAALDQMEAEKRQPGKGATEGSE